MENLRQYTKKAEPTVIIFIPRNIIESFASQPSLYTLNNLLTHLKMFNLDICIYQGPRNGNGNGNENFEKAKGLDQRNNNFARPTRFFVYFFPVPARLWREDT